MTLNVRPVDLPGLRDETVAFVDREGREQYRRALIDGRQNMRPPGTPTMSADILAREEMDRLRSADLFYVAPEMTDLAIAAGAALPEFTLMPEDLPSSAGFIVFGKPIAVVDYSEFYDGEGASPIVAASWSHWDGGNPWWRRNGGGCWVTYYADVSGMVDVAIQRGLITERDALRFRTRAGRLMIDNESQSPFSPNPLPIVDSGGREVSPAESMGVFRWLAVLKTTWLLMTQPVASVTDAHYDRAARRRIQKQGKEPPVVRVINLRRQHGAGGGGASDRERHHQWIVRGHWRQQWYPVREVHRPVWIAPHIKGPEGLPLLGGEKVHAWVR